MPVTARPEPRPPLDPASAAVRSAVRRTLTTHIVARDAASPRHAAGTAPHGGTHTGTDGSTHAAAKAAAPGAAAPAGDTPGDLDATAPTGVPADAPLVLVALSGGPDSLALAAATAFEAPKLGLRAGAVIVDHALQPGSATVAETAAAHARTLGLDPVLVTTVEVPQNAGAGPESAARDARYGAFDQALAETGASGILLGHTLDDQAETVLLGLARGAGPASLRGMAEANGPFLRPLLAVHRAETHDSCAALGLTPWADPHNDETRFSRVRVRTSILPVLERELGPGVADALARTADILREDSEALDRMVDEIIEEICEPAEAGIAVDVRALAVNPAALRNRIIRVVADGEFGQSLSRAHTLEIARLVTDWRGQGPIDVPGFSVRRDAGLLVFTAHTAPHQHP